MKSDHSEMLSDAVLNAVLARTRTKTSGVLICVRDREHKDVTRERPCTRALPNLLP